MRLCLIALMLLAVTAVGCTSAPPASAPTDTPASAAQAPTSVPASTLSETTASSVADSATRPVPQEAAPAQAAVGPSAAQAQPTSPPASPQPTPLPSPTPHYLAGLSPETRAQLEHGTRLLLAADYHQASQYFEDLVARLEGDGRIEALLRLGQALAGAHQNERAIETLQGLRQEHGSAPQATQALFHLAQAEAQRGQIEAAATHIEALANAQPDLAPSAWLKLAEWALLAERAEIAAQAAEAGWQDAKPRLLRIELLENLGDARTALGDPEGAYQAYREILAVAGTSSYLGEQLYNLASAYVKIGRDEEALRALQTAVEDFPRARTAPHALQLLEEMGQLDSVDGYSIGRVRYIWGNYRGAIAAFDRYLREQPEGPDAEAARLYRALSTMAPGSEGPSIAQLESLAAQAEDEEIAALALLEAGKGYESMGGFGRAVSTYQALQSAQPLEGTEGAEESKFRLGVAHYMNGDNDSALAAWRAALDQDPESESRAQLLYWSGKALQRAGRGEEARQVFEQAAAQRPISYFALRAHRQLQPERAVGDLAQVVPSAEQRAREEQELARWFAARHLDLERARAVVQADPAFPRALELADLGLYREAGWEFEELLTRHREYGDRLYVAADAFLQRGLYYAGARLGMEALVASTADESALDVPRALARAAYPLAFADLVWPMAQQRGIDPLLFTALMRQESEFDQFAKSVADARGLAQLIPPTAREVAAGLGVRPFSLELLNRPAVNVRFGTTYFAERLARHNGNIYLALAAYNAGDGNVGGWLRPARVADPDVFAEYVPFEETHDYVRKIAGYWQIYRALYAQ